MQIKVFWEEKDVKCGMRLALKNGSTERAMIGYDPNDSPDSRLHLISLADGMIFKKHLSSKDMAKHLTDNNYIPETMLTSHPLIMDKIP